MENIRIRNAIDRTASTQLRTLPKGRLHSGSTDYALAQTTYNADDTVQCVATRMNPAIYGSLPSSACTQGTAGSYGPDQITQNSYDPAGQLTQVQLAVGTSGAATERTLTYNANGTLATLKDGMNNLTTYVYDGFDRLSQTQYPSATQGAGTSNPSDFIQLGYDANSNITSKRNRDATSITYAFDALNRITSKTLPTAASGAAGYSLYYGYDLLGRELYSRFSSSSGSGITNTYDALGRMVSSSSNMDGTARTVTSTYDSAGNRTLVAVNVAGYGANISIDHLNRMTASAGLVQLAYDSHGRRSSVSYGSASSATYGYDPVDRLSSLTHDLAGTASDETLTFGYDPASQITTRTSSNDSYAYNGLVNVSRGYTTNGRNQYTAAGTASFTYDANGNLTSDGSNTFTYDAENKLVSVSGAHTATLKYDPRGRLWQISAGSGTTDFIYDGDHDITETDGSGNFQREFIWGPGADEPLVQWDNAGQKMLHADNQGSVISLADSNGNIIATDSYDEYGTPGSANQGRFQYTGQAWLSEIGLYYYKARMYSPTAGRFLQTDPIGYGDGPNWYDYSHNDPINIDDPSGLLTIIITGHRQDVAAVYATLTAPAPPSAPNEPPSGGIDTSGGDDCANGGNSTACTITVTGKKKKSPPLPPPPPPPPPPPTPTPQPQPDDQCQFSPTTGATVCTGKGNPLTIPLVCDMFVTAVSGVVALLPGAVTTVLGAEGGAAGLYACEHQ